MIGSPFKFLDSYTREDRAIFFGRDQEITDLYRRVFESKMLLVYGVSGTGKSSLINCGLASRFDDSDWLPVNVRRGSNIVDSLNEAFNKQAIRPFRKNLTVAEKLQSIYLDHFKPVYLIFDQFEELFIFGSHEEKKGFIKLIKEIVDSETQCRIIFVIREEFLAGITEFECDLPEIFSNRFRVEKMKRSNAISSIEGPCKVHNIVTEEGFSEELIDKLCPTGNDIELTFLQIYLDRIFRLTINEKPETGNITFSKEVLTRAGSVSDLLGQFLDEQIREFEDPESGMAILKSFVSVQGTKRQMNEYEIIDAVKTFRVELTERSLLKHLTKFVDLRILRERDDAGHFELRHDSLAAKIYEKFTALEKDIIEVRQFVENAWNSWKKRNILISSADLDYISPYEGRLYLPSELYKLIEKSKLELTKVRKRKRNIAVFTAALLVFVFAVFTLWALNERRKSNIERNKALAVKYNLIASKVVETDPTIALRLAEFGQELDSSNIDISQNILNIYYNNFFYKIIGNPDEELSSAIFSPDGKAILTGSKNKKAILWDLNGKLIRDFNGHSAAVTSVSFSPDGQVILTGSADKTARLWDLKGNLLQLFIGHTKSIRSVGFSSDAQNIITGSNDGTVRIWDTKGNQIKMLTDLIDPVTSVSFSKDSKEVLIKVAQYGFLEKICLWKIEGNQVIELKKKDPWNPNGMFLPDGKTILTGREGGLKKWDLSGKYIGEIKGNFQKINSFACSDDGNILYINDSKIHSQLIDMDGTFIQELKGDIPVITSASFSSDNRKLLTRSFDGKVQLWDLSGFRIRDLKAEKGSIKSVSSSQYSDWITAGTDNGDVNIWDNNGILIKCFNTHSGSILSLTFSPDGQKILTGSIDKTASIWNLNGERLKFFSGHDSIITSVAYSPDGKTILTRSNDKTIRIWNLESDKPVILKEPDGFSSIIAFGENGKIIYTTNYLSGVYLWDLNGNPIIKFKSNPEEIWSAAFSPDGNQILLGESEGTARLFDVEGVQIAVLKGHRTGILTTTFSPDGKTILTGSLDQTAKYWDLQGNQIGIMKDKSGYFNKVDFSPDQKTILTQTNFNIIRLWDLYGNQLKKLEFPEKFIVHSAFIKKGNKLLLSLSDKAGKINLEVHDLKEPYRLFNNSDSYAQLSTPIKILYGILNFDLIRTSGNESLISEASDYYLSTSSDKVDKNILQYIRNSHTLREILVDKFGKKYIPSLLYACYFLYDMESNPETGNELINLNIEIGNFNSYESISDAIPIYTNLVSKIANDSSIIEFNIVDTYLKICRTLIDSTKKWNESTSYISQPLSDLSFKLLENRQYANALISVELAIMADSTNQFAYSNLPIAYIFNNEFKKAEDMYYKWKDKPWTGQIKTFREIFLADINSFESKGITHPDFEKVKELLKK